MDGGQSTDVKTDGGWDGGIMKMWICSQYNQDDMTWESIGKVSNMMRRSMGFILGSA